MSAPGSVEQLTIEWAGSPSAAVEPPTTADAVLAILHSSLAGEHFRLEGEAGYQKFVLEQLRHSPLPELQEMGEREQERLAQPSPPRALAVATPPAPRPAKRTLATMARLDPATPTSLRLVSTGPPATRLPAEPEATQPISLDQMLEWDTDTYARLVALQRLDHGSAMLMNEQRLPRGATFLRRLGATALDPLRIGEYLRAEDLQAEVATARQQYQTTVGAYLLAMGSTPDQRISWKISQARAFEARVAELMPELALSQSGGPRWLRRGWDKTRQQVANWWVEGSALRRIGMIALLPVGLGVGLGLTAASLAAPVPAAIALGGAATWVGGAANGWLARTVNRFQALNPARQRLLVDDAEDLLQGFATSHPLFSLLSGLQVQDVHQAVTERYSTRNLANLESMRRIGMLLAAATFGATDVVAMHLQAWGDGQYAHTASPQPTATHEVIASPPTQAGLDPAYDAYPWDVAQRFWPGQALDHIRQFVPGFNASHPGADLNLAFHSSYQGHHNVWVLEQNGQEVGGTLRASFNQYMANHAVATQF